MCFFLRKLLGFRYAHKARKRRHDDAKHTLCLQSEADGGRDPLHRAAIELESPPLNPHDEKRLKKMKTPKRFFEFADKDTETSTFAYKEIESVWFPLEKLWKDFARTCAVEDTLTLSNWRVVDGDFIAIGQVCNKVSVLELANLTEITFAGLQRLKDFSSCTKLDLSGCPAVDDATAEHLRKHFVNLTWLNLSRTAVGDVGLAHVFAGVRKLESLWLRCCAAVTSTGIKELSDYGKMRKTLRFVDLGESTRFSNDSLLQLLIECGSQLREIRLDGCRQVDFLGLLGLRRNVGALGLMRLDLSNLDKICHGPSLLESICASCRFLIELRLSGLCAAIDDVALGAFTNAVQSSPNTPPPLQILVLDGCAKITSAAIGPFLKTIAATLTHLDVSSCSKLDDAFGSQLGDLRNLRRLKLVNVPLFSDVAFLALVARVREVEDARPKPKWIKKQEDEPKAFPIFDLDAAAAVTGTVDNSTRCRVPRYGSKGVTAFVKEFGANLMRINLDGASRINDAAVTCIACCCPLLERVGLEKCASVTNIGVTHIAEKCLRLERLRVPGCGGHYMPLTDEVAYALALHCHELRMLDISRSRVTSAGCLELSRGCKKLETVKLNDCDQVNDDGVRALIEGCSCLRVLNLAGCDDIRDAGFSSLSKNHVDRRDSRFYPLEVCDLHRASMGRGVPASVLQNAAKFCLPFARRNLERDGFQSVPLPVKNFVLYQLHRRREHKKASQIQRIVRSRRVQKWFLSYKATIINQRRVHCAAKVVQKMVRRVAERKDGRKLLEKVRAAIDNGRKEVEVARRCPVEAGFSRSAAQIHRLVCTAYSRYRMQRLCQAWQQFVLISRFEAHRDRAARIIAGLFRRRQSSTEREPNASLRTSSVSEDITTNVLCSFAAAALLVQRFFRAKLELTKRRELHASIPVGADFKEEQACEAQASAKYESDIVAKPSTEQLTAESTKTSPQLEVEVARVVAANRCQAAWRFFTRRRAIRKKRAAQLVMHGWRWYRLRLKVKALRRRKARAMAAFKRLAGPGAIEELIREREDQVLAMEAEAAQLAIVRQRAVRVLQRTIRSHHWRWLAVRGWPTLRQNRAAVAIQQTFKGYLRKLHLATELQRRHSAASAIIRFMSCWLKEQKFRKLRRALAIRKEQDAMAVKHDLIKRKQERVLRRCFLKGRERSATKIQRKWRAHRTEALERAERVADREARLREALPDFELSEKTVEAKMRTRKLARNTKKLAIETIKTGAKIIMVSARLAAQAVGPTQPTVEDIVRKGYDLPTLPKPKKHERIMNFILDRKPAEEKKERDEQIGNSILNLQTRSMLPRGIYDLALTVGSEEVVSMDEKNGFNARVKQPVFTRINRDLSGTRKLKVYMWYSLGSGPRVLTDVTVRRAPANHLNKAANKSRLYGAYLGGTIIRGHEKLTVELHGEAGVFMGRALPPIDSIGISRNEKEEAELKQQNFCRVTPALSIGGSLANYHLWIHRRKVYEQPVLNTLLMGQLRQQPWWNGDDDRMRKVIATYALPLEAVLEIRRSFDSINFAKGEHVQVNDWLESIGVAHAGERPAYVNWLIELIELQSATNSHMDFGEYIALVTTLCMFDKLEMLRWVFKSSTGK